MCIHIYVYVCMVCACVERARRGFLWLTNGRRRSTSHGERGQKDKRGTCGTCCARNFFLYITIHIHSYTYMFINRIIDWELFLSALLSGSLSTPRSACLYINIHTHTCVCVAANWACRRDKCVCMKKHEWRRLDRETRKDEQWSCGIDARAIS